MRHLRDMMQKDPIPEGPPRRGYAGQRVERERERIVRFHAVKVSERIAEQGWTLEQTAQFLNLSVRTLRDWRHDFAIDVLHARPLGRPIFISTRDQRNDVFHYLGILGPGIGVPTLRLMFPEVARAELEELLRRYRCLWRKNHRRPLHVLNWTAPGRVWAIDFHEPRPLIDGCYPDLFAIRDLASGEQLAWLPTADMTAPTVIDSLTSQFKEHGAPLILKSDNGSAFGAVEVRNLLEKYGVKILFSPPGMPRYNGAIEAGIGSLKSRTEQHAARRGYPGVWTYDDTTAARLEANETARPRGPLGPSPDQMWASRTPIASEERDRFEATFARLREQIERVQGWPPDNADNVMARRAIDRQALSRALVEHGYLHYTRRRILPLIPRQTAASIT